MRLIDADKIINSLGSSDVDLYISGLIDEQPTAFDVDKVVSSWKQERQELLHYRKHRSISRVKLMRLKLQSKS